MLRFYRALNKTKLFANGSGQAAAELAMAMLIIVPLLCATIDFGRAFYELQVISELSRQGSSLALRGEGTTSCDTLCTAGTDLIAGILRPEPFSQRHRDNFLAQPTFGHNWSRSVWHWL